MEVMNIIFDLGSDRTYIKNAIALGIELDKILGVIISHRNSNTGR